MGVANFRVKNGLFVAETTGSAGNLTIVDGQIDSDGGLLLDAAGDITLDAAGSDILLAKNGVNFGQLTNSSDDFVIRSLISDEPMVFKGNDGGVNTTVLTLDMANAGAATFNAGITLGGNITGAADVDTSIIPDAGHYVDIDGLFKVTPSITAHVDLDDTAQGSDANNLTGDANNFINFPESGQVYVESTTASENPYTYTGKNADSSTLTGLTGLDTISASNVMVTLAPKNTTIAGQRYATGNVGQFGADGGQVTIDGGKWGNATSTWAVGVNYGAVILNEATSIMKLDTVDVASGTIYKDGAHMEVIPHVKIGSETPNTLTTGTDYFTGYFKTNASSGAVVNEKLFYNQIIHVDTLAMMKIKSSVMNTETQYNDAIGSAMVLETATAGEMNQLLFNFDNTNAERYLSTGSGTLGASGYAYSVGGVYKSGGTSQSGTSASNFGIGYMNRSFNQAGADLNSGPFTNGSGTYGAQGNPLATENTFFQANSSGLVGIGPAQTPSAFATIHVGATGATNVGGAITFDSGSADPSTTANTLYNKGGNIYWGTSNLSAASANALNDLSDVSFSAGNLVIDALDLVSPSATAHNVAGTALVVQGGTTTAGTTDNIAGGNLTLAGGQGKGSGAGGDIIFQVANQGDSGSSLNSLAEVARIADHGYFGIGTATPTSHLSITSTAASGATGGASIILAQDDGATTASGHRLGVIDFAGAEDSSGTLTVGARIQALTEEAYDASNNDTKLEFYTTTGNSSGTLALTLKHDSTALFSGAAAPISDDGSALGTSSLNWSDLFLADGAVINLGDDQDVTLTHYADNGLLLNSTRKLYFEDGSNYDQYIGSAGSGVTAIAAPTEIDLTAPTLDINASTEVNVDTPSFVLTSSTSDKPDMVIKNTNDDATGPSLTFTLDTGNSALANDVAGTISFVADDADNNQTEYGRVQVKANAVTGGSESGKILFGVATTDSGAYADVMTITGGADAAGSTVEVAGSLSVVGDLNITGDVNSTSVTDLDVVDKTITVASGATNSSDSNASGITFGGSGATLQYIHATTSINVNKPLILTGTTASSNATTGELIVGGGAGIAADLSVGDDLRLTSDASVFSMGNGADITITHDGSTGGTLASAGAFIIDGGDNITLDQGDDKHVVFAQAGVDYLAIGQGTAAIANILDTAGATDIDTFTCTTFQATKYIILVEDVTNANYMTTEILLLGDENGASDAAPYLTQYAVVFNDHELGVFAATGSGDTVTLTYDPTDDGVSGDDNHKVRVVAQRIASI
tara:strand:+ start:620 stop:4429 length:3810 start_codon:yes stop_codon:yes gene_type:complete